MLDAMAEHDIRKLLTSLQELHDQFNKWGKEEYNLYSGGNAASGKNYLQDSTTKSRNVIAGDIPPGPSKKE